VSRGVPECTRPVRPVGECQCEWAVVSGLGGLAEPPLSVRY
jgi:hypothetical protein